jgi:hypothetical protein
MSGKTTACTLPNRFLSKAGCHRLMEKSLLKKGDIKDLWLARAIKHYIDIKHLNFI